MTDCIDIVHRKKSRRFWRVTWRSFRIFARYLAFRCWHPAGNHSRCGQGGESGLTLYNTSTPAVASVGFNITPKGGLDRAITYQSCYSA